jgi:hypothetical protein
MQRYLLQKTHYVSATKINRSTLYRETLFTARTVRNIQIHSVDRMQSFSMLKKVVHIVTIVLIRSVVSVYKISEDGTLI